MSEQQTEPDPGLSDQSQRSLAKNAHMPRVLKKYQESLSKYEVSQGAVSDSLNAFITSEHNSAITKQLSASSASAQALGHPKNPRIINNKRPKNPPRASQSRQLQFKRELDPRVQKYLRRNVSENGNITQNESVLNKTSTNLSANTYSEEHQSMLQAIGCAGTKQPNRSSSVTNKQVRFDIKQGLREMIRETSFDVGKVKDRQINKRKVKDGKLPPKGAQAARSPTQRQNHHMQSSRSGEDTNLNNMMTASFGANSATPGAAAVRSPSSSKRQSMKMALLYKKEVLEGKLRRGEINADQLDRVLSQKRSNASDVASPRSSHRRRSCTGKMDGVQSSGFVQQHEVDVDELEETDQETPQKNRKPPVPQEKPLMGLDGSTNIVVGNQSFNGASKNRAKAKAGSIFRMRSDSPLNSHTNNSHSFSPQATAVTLNNQLTGNDEVNSAEDVDEKGRLAMQQVNTSGQLNRSASTQRAGLAGQIMRAANSGSRQRLQPSGAIAQQARDQSTPQSFPQRRQLHSNSSHKRFEPTLYMQGDSRQDVRASQAAMESGAMSRNDRVRIVQDFVRGVEDSNRKLITQGSYQDTHQDGDITSPPSFAAESNRKQFTHQVSTERLPYGQGQRISPRPNQLQLQALHLQNQTESQDFNGLEQNQGVTQTSQRESSRQMTQNYYQYQHQHQESASQCMDCQEEQFQFFPCIWQIMTVSEDELLIRVHAFRTTIQASKERLHEPLRQNSTLQIDSSMYHGSEHNTTVNISALFQRQLEDLVGHRLRLIRANLRSALLDSFLPLVHEIVQLRDKLAFRKRSLRLSIMQPLKASIIQDICSRLSQKLVIKVLFLQQQLRKNTSSLFSAYYDLLVKKPTLALTFALLKRNVARRREKETYLGYACDQMTELRKVQVFDCWKRLKRIEILRKVKQRQSCEILQKRRLLRILGAWKVEMVNQRCSDVGSEMAHRFRVMKNRHQLFARWVQAHLQSNKIKNKAIKMVNRQQEQQLGLRDSQSSLASSTISAHYLTGTEEESRGTSTWLVSVVNQSQEMFYSDIQELLLEREHLCTFVKQVKARNSIEKLDARVPLMFKKDDVTGFGKVHGDIWLEVPSQALISNREQIYVSYPELQKPSTARNSALGSMMAPRNRSALQQVTNEEQDYQSEELERSQMAAKTDLSLALQPALQKHLLMAMPISSTTSLPNADHEQVLQQEKQLDAKYSVHQALVLQQNLFAEIAASKRETAEFSEAFSGQACLDSASLSKQQRDTDRVIPIQQFAKVNETDTITSQMIPLKCLSSRQTLQTLNAQTARDASKSKAPNQLFAKLQKQIEQVASADNSQNKQIQPASSASAGQTGSCVPQSVQLKEHIREMAGIVLRLEDVPLSYHRAQSLQQVFLENGLSADLPSDGEMSLSDYIQVALQQGTSLEYLNLIKQKSLTMWRWKLALANKLLNDDLAQFQQQQKGIAALQAIRAYIRQRELKAVNYWKTKQMEKFYRLFTRWSQANHTLIYERTKLVHHFRLRFVTRRWRQYTQGHSFKRRNEKASIHFYCHKLHTKAMVALYQNYLKALRIRKFKQRQAYLKYFKRRWLPGAKKKQLLRRVISRCEEREEENAKTRYQRQFDLLHSVLVIWKKRVYEQKKVVKAFMALRHYKFQLLLKYFYHLKRSPYKTRGCIKLVKVLYRAGLQKPFKEIRRYGNDQQQLVEDWRTSHQTCVVQRVLAVWHSMAVQRKIAKMFFKRKFLSALQDFVFEKNYIRPTALREHTLKRKAVDAFKQIKKLRWQKERRELIERALVQKHSFGTMRSVFLKLIDNILKQKGKRIMASTVADFRKHFLSKKCFRLWKLFRALQRRKHLMNQVAAEFRDERIKRQVAEGKSTWTDRSQQEALVKKVFLSWQLEAHIDRRKNFKLKQFLEAKEQLVLVKCFLSWRSVARFEYSDMDRSTPNGAYDAKIVVARQQPELIYHLESYQDTHETPTPSQLTYHNHDEDSYRLPYKNHQLQKSINTSGMHISSHDNILMRGGNDASYEEIAGNSSMKQIMARYGHANQDSRLGDQSNNDIEMFKQGDSLNRQVSAALINSDMQSPLFAQGTYTRREVDNYADQSFQNSNSDISNIYKRQCCKERDDAIKKGRKSSRNSDKQSKKLRLKSNRSVSSSRSRERLNHSVHQKLAIESTSSKPLRKKPSKSSSKHQTVSNKSGKQSSRQSKTSRTLNQSTGSVKGFKAQARGVPETSLKPQIMQIGQIVNAMASGKSSKQVTVGIQSDTERSKDTSHRSKSRQSERQSERTQKNQGACQRDRDELGSALGQYYVPLKDLSESKDFQYATTKPAEHARHWTATEGVTRDYLTNQVRDSHESKPSDSAGQGNDKHFASITLSHQTDLYQELESIYKHNNDWIKEQAEREKILKQMAQHYNTGGMTSLSSADDPQSSRRVDENTSFAETSLASDRLLMHGATSSLNPMGALDSSRRH